MSTYPEITSIQDKLEAKTRDELYTLARSLKLRGYRRLTKPQLVVELLKVDPSKLAAQLSASWWHHHHNHVYGAATFIGLALTVVAIWPGSSVETDEFSVEAARDIVMSKAHNILRKAHPTSTFLNIEYKGVEEYRNNERGASRFQLSFEIKYQDFKNPLSTKEEKQLQHELKIFAFFDSGGNLQTIEWGPDTGQIPPGAAMSAMSTFLKKPITNSEFRNMDE